MLQVGQIVKSSYQITEQIGTGGSGTVFKAKQLSIDRDVAIKLIHENVKSIVDVRAEVNILKNLKHSYLPVIIDFIEDEDNVYTVMEYIHGTDFQALVNGGKMFDEKEVCRYMIQLCDAVEYLHSQNPHIIHSDIKPANIMLTVDDNICLIDFNISTVSSDGRAVSYGGSNGFAAPEQFKRVISKPIDADSFHEKTRFIRSDETEFAFNEAE